MANRPRISPVLTYYIQQVRRYPKLTWGVLLSMPITTLVNGYLPGLILASVLSRLADHNFQPHDVWGNFGPSILAFIGLALIGIVGWRVVDYCVFRLEAHIQRDMAQQVFDHLVRESADFHANHFGGSLVSQNSKLLGGYIRTADTTFYLTLQMISGVIIASIILWFHSPVYVLVLDAFVVTYITVSLLVSRPVQRAAGKHAAAESIQTGSLADAITNVMTIKSFGRRNYEHARFAKVSDATHGLIMDFTRMHQRQMNVLASLNRSLLSASLLMAIISVMVFDANIATVFLIFNFTTNIVGQLFDFSNGGLRNYNRAFGDAADMVKILSEQPAVLDPMQPEPVRIEQGHIKFDHVVFTHVGADDAIFDDLSLEIQPGEKIGLVGHSGSGKTTFTRLLLRFSDIEGGAILIDGQNIANIAQDDLHDKIAYVPQEPLLFHRTIGENIGYGDLHADQARIEAVAKLAHAHDFIAKLPKGYDTLVGERGVKLSGGQRQRVAIARAMLKNAPILALDEATSALDSESEAVIQDALWKLMEGKTALVIAHRLSTIQKMDRIVVLHDGRILEQGSHQELLAKKGTYAKLWSRQSGGFIDD